MDPNHGIDNNKLANLICSKNFASHQQIVENWTLIAPGRDIGRVLVEKGILPVSIYAKMVSYLQQTTAVHQNTPSPRVSSPPPQAVSPVNEPVEHPTDLYPLDEQKSEIADVDDPVVSNSVSQLSCFESMFRYARSVDASDVHLSVNNPVIVRRYGVLSPVKSAVLTSGFMEAQIMGILTEEQYCTFCKNGDLECVVAIEGCGRFRVTVLKQRSGWDLTARCIPDRIRSFEETGMPLSCKALTQWSQGLVLVTGSASCGKSSTLATLIEMINQTRPDHIITLESPIEQLFESAKSHITQRQLGRDTLSQETALRAALREDPDVIVVGELRDLATIQLAVSAAETGHLVFGTMNTVSASRTIYRLIDSFPPEDQSIIRNMVSESLRGVISQQLIPRLDGSGLVAAYEVLLVNSAVSNMIRKDEAYQLGTAMITGKACGMQLLDDSLRMLVSQGIISQQEVNDRCVMKLSGEK
jgi:twitching motility protein PilT